MTVVALLQLNEPCRTHSIWYISEGSFTRRHAQSETLRRHMSHVLGELGLLVCNPVIS